MNKVSVIIPVYNVEKYLRQCLDSIVNQTLKEIEIICVDDGSSDSSPAILAEYAAKDPRVKVLTREKSNAGAARNAGMAVATGEYLGFVDSDDWCELTLFEKAYKRAKETDADVVSWQYDRYDDITKKFGVTLTFPKNKTEKDFFNPLAYGPWQRLVCHKLLIQENLKFQPLPRFNDVFFCCMVLAVARKKVDLVENLYHYRVNTRTNLQAGIWKTPLSVEEAWAGVVVELKNRGLTSLLPMLFDAAMNSLFYTLHSIDDEKSACEFFFRLKKELSKNGCFSNVDQHDIQNSHTRFFLNTLRSSETATQYFVFATKFLRSSYSETYWKLRERISNNAVISDQCARLQNEVEGLRNRVSQLQSHLAKARKEISSLGKSASYRVGLFVTWPLRKLKLIYLCLPRLLWLLVPTGIVRYRLMHKGYDINPISKIKLIDLIANCLPSFFWAMVFMRAENDRTIIKYFLPYGYMRAFIIKHYYADKACPIKFKNRTGLSRILSFLLPYGLVQWWDFGQERLAGFYIGVADNDKRQDLWGRVLNRNNPLEADLLSEPSNGAELEWLESLGEKIFAQDRLDLMGFYLEIVALRTRENSLNHEDVGRLIKSLGWPFIRALISSYGRVKSLDRILQECANLAVDVRQPIFGRDVMPKIDSAGITESTNGDPLVSVIMPVYNCAPYLIRAIESVRKQSYSNWELICVNDGSLDESASILDWYASVDKRVRVIHKQNSGVSDTRNQGLKAALGDYVLFIDGDDWYELNALEEAIRVAKAHDLELCLFDFRCRKFDTLKEVFHFWTFSHLSKCWDINNRVFAASILNKWFFYGSLCQMAWKRSFLLERDAKFAKIPLGEDFTLMCELFPYVKRAFVINKPFYNYQRGNPTSAVSRIGAEKGAAFIAKYERLCAIDQEVYSREDIAPMRNLFLGRVLADLSYDCRVAPIVADWLRKYGYKALKIDEMDSRYVLDPNHLDALRRIYHTKEQEVGNVADRPSPEIVEKLRSVEAKRDNTSEKSVYLVSAQLGSLNDDAIDGWSFFRYLKKCGKDARFVMHKMHRRYAEFKAEFPNDVIAIDSDKDFSYLTACEDIFPRVKAIAMEWPITNSFLSRWISKLSNCCYVFLQHGVTFNPPRAVHHHYWQEFNLINFCSEREKTMVMPAIGGYDRGITPVVAGLPRWDVLKDEQDVSERIVFVMFTWRPTFNQIPKRFANSAYANGLRRLLSPQNVARLKANGLKVVLAQHHALRDVDLRSLELSKDVVMGGDRPVSYWIRHAACLLTDFSSAAFDFWCLDKPTVYWIPDLYDSLLSDDDQNKVRQADTFLSNFVNQVATPDEAINLIIRYAKAGFALEEATKEITHTYFRQDKDACQRIVAAIDENLTR